MPATAIDPTIRPCKLDSRWLVMQDGPDSWFLAGLGVSATIRVRRWGGRFWPVVVFADGRERRCWTIEDAIELASF